MLHNLTGWHALVILAVILLVFGAAKLPALARSVGESVRILKAEVVDPDQSQTAQSRLPAGGAAVDPARATGAALDASTLEHAAR